MIPSKISTDRLTLVRLTNTHPSHPHVQLFHENWSNPTATAWSLRGTTHSLAESREWMIESLDRFDNYFYAVFEGDEEDELGVHIGSVSLRLQPSGPTLPPLSLSRHIGSPDPEKQKGSGEDDIPLRALGYAIFPTAWGKGYGTEANRGLLNAYSAAVAQQSGGKGRVYVEAAVDDENAGSLALIQKLGFERVGWKESEKVWLNGGWRGGYWVYGLYI
ncbi:hypothetical protein COCMIDRAFT_34697 [Bipolaris oryzae ATCC 44560]|uniref:N-acetyltransferase domain-containing protein n=1 Tax=Bipolaris oryzae ATCC 44560 TaxID=930090 RepID=W6ZCV6_COCMI|nr:uncharacterized protein COCMIDRAFT_34697 [Bipolaris oryzae ATCC 44560]EUC47785.1 hypothetical protein COCMIDRAFT_34697 [Bipolaris oryzae ATCC 44560]